MIRHIFSEALNALADEYILNTGTVDEALAAFGEIIDRHTAA